MKQSARKTPELDFQALSQAAECLRVLAHPSRLQIVQRLQSGQPHTVTEIAEQCRLSQPATSDHLRLMQRCGFLRSRREGRLVYYEIAEPHLLDIIRCIQKRFAKGG